MASSIAPFQRSALSPQQALKLANAYMESAWRTDDNDVALVLCNDTEMALAQAKKAVKRAEDPCMKEDIAKAYMDLGNILKGRERASHAEISYKKAQKLGTNAQDSGRFTKAFRLRKRPSTPAGDSQACGPLQVSPQSPRNQHRNTIITPAHIFVEDIRPAAVEYKLPEPDERLSDTSQLAYCLYLLNVYRPSDGILEPMVQNWLQATKKDPDEQERLQTMATEVIRVFKRDEIKDAKTVAEVTYLAPVLNKEAFQELLGDFCSGIEHSSLHKPYHLEGLAQLIQNAGPGHFSADDLVKILELLSSRLQKTHEQSVENIHQLTLAVSRVLDAMADANVTGLDREKLHEPLSAYLEEHRRSRDPYLMYQAAYAYQALLCVPDNETPWQAALRRTGNVVTGFSRMACAVTALDLMNFMDGLDAIQKEVAQAVTMVATAWADVLIRNGELASFKKLVCEAPCRMDPAFQIGVCQRLGEIAVNPLWGKDTRQNAIAFLGEIYKKDDVWGQDASVKQWILNILIQLVMVSGSNSQSHNTDAEKLLRELETNGDGQKQMMYRSYQEKDPISYPLRIPQPELASSTLLDRVQNRPDVEGNLRALRKQRTKERGNAVYIPPQAKASLQVADSTRFPLMEKVNEFLKSEQKVFLLIGDTGSGKSTFNKELEFELWLSYKTKTGRIPLHINLPAIDKPEYDMIAKQLRRAEFTEPQIREMKHHRKFILICDGYDESQQTHNLYMSNRLNEAGEWDAQMVISCRTEYLGTDYRDRFQPRDRNHQSDSSLLQEAVITPFSMEQVHVYIKQYVNLHQPLWNADDYTRALELIPSLKELVKNPFLMTLSLEVLPRVVDPGHHMSVTQVTRVGLYDHFVEQWLERGKKRLGEKDLNPQARSAFESLNDEGFTQHGIEFLKRLAVAIYKEQDGHPIVRYSRATVEQPWKSEFFSRDEEKRLLREACPLARNGNQHRFIHRSLLEYALARAVFDPQEGKMLIPMPAMGRRGSVGSTLSFEAGNVLVEQAALADNEPDPNSPLVWRSFVNDYSLLKLLEERVQQEPLFKTRLLAYIEHSKKDKKWRRAAASAMTILVRAGEQFIGTDLRGIQIPGADLSYGVFDAAQLQNADLRKVNFRGVWLRQTDLSGAQMTGVQFGELPYLTEDIGIRSCAYSPDGKSIAVGLWNGNINVYSISNWEKIRTLSGHNNRVRRIVYSPRGDQIASAGLDKTVRLWDALTGQQQRVLKVHSGCVHGVAYSPEGDPIASCSDGKAVRIWDVNTESCRDALCGHTEEVLSVTYSPHGDQVASCSEDRTIRLWNLEKGECRAILEGHTDKIWETAFSPHGNQVASASEDKTVRLWDIEKKACLHVLTGHISAVHCIAYSPKGDQVTSGGLDTTVRVWDVETGSCLHAFPTHRHAVYVVAYSLKGDQVASGSFDKSLRLWDVSASTSRFNTSGHTAAALTINCSPTRDLVVSGSLDRTIHLWDMETGACLGTVPGHDATIFSATFSPQGDHFVSGCGDGLVRLWEVKSKSCQSILAGHSGEVTSVAFSPKGDTIVSAGQDMTVRFWNTENGKCRGELTGHTRGVNSVVFASNGKQIATASDDMTARLWDVDARVCSKVLEGHNDLVKSAVYSPQGDQLATASVDKSIRLWDIQTGVCHLTLEGHTESVMGITYSGDGALLASGSVDKTVYEEEDYQCDIRLRWSGANGALTVMGASIQGARGLSGLNKQLLKQCGATGEPENRFREAGKKVMTMAAVVSRLRMPSGRTAVESSASAYPPLNDFPVEPLGKTENTKSRRFTVGRRDAVPQHL
ncbi:hypothetical protein BGX34_009760 [Mortierella sp. NVP85]|nr:hypothetical protein BGX34_009760 [Mortierella sp. NVP85]